MQKSTFTTLFALILLGASGILGSIRGYELSQYRLVLAKVVSIRPYETTCRRPSGRAEICLLSRVALSYSDTRIAPEPVEAFLTQETRSEHFDVGRTVRVAVKPSSPKVAEVFYPSRGWTAALSLLSAGTLLLIISRYRASAQKIASV